MLPQGFYAVALIISLIIYCIRLYRKNKLEIILMSEQSKIQRMLIGVVILSIIFFIELVHISPPSYVELVLNQSSQGYTNLQSKVFLYSSLIVAMAIALGTLTYFVLYSIIEIIEEFDKTKFYIYMDEEYGVQRQWFINKITDHKKVILYYYDSNLKIKIYRLEDIDTIRKHFIYQMNKKSSEIPQQRIVRGNQEPINM